MKFVHGRYRIIMFDILALFFHAARYSVKAIAAPSDDPTTRRLEFLILFLSATGTLLLVGSIWHMIRFDMRGPLWAYLLISATVCWGTAACIGNAHESSTPRND